MPENEEADLHAERFSGSPVPFPEELERLVASVVPRPVLGPVDGSVERWLAEEGWGVLVSPAVDGGVWTHYSNIDRQGYRELSDGEPVQFTYETPGQDGYPHRAVHVNRLS